MLLAIDTASRQASVALYDERGVRAESSWHSADNQSVELMPRLTEMLAQQGIAPAGLRGVAVAIGPGSFTGLRIGLSVAKGLAVGRGIPVLGLPTLDALAQALVGQRLPLRAVLNIGRGRYAIADYRVGRDQWHRTSKDRLATPAELTAGVRERTLFAGEIGEPLRRTIETALDGAAVLLPPALQLRRAGYLAELGWQRLLRGDRDDPATLAPIYLHTQPVGEAAACT
ncbi:MAG TPA: tRNA (adenosine(37)-N6)-threonylcarbamoyltransferase complex dimerization subunit type 1 TsaB [Anaerolineae bacterium]|nr:tRNA (adenosine(37)-N6)-threonylcarbamoyltransferase complex dimerization subunit type 1 TsaB [Anaerolineae bacterium]HOQ98489.1 tRNA (adenosine(37)-N6)-threonylcarbamoyltransferase complex dimerization subunit type 1 TsaB [Anaerolineae bacterium]HPL28113.1 tRNA (adenosine(37)-N6)-threonylcarbamoyltransferase complex dimerization subunit type 1 TsaB [Anaerolineae bacterium]